MNAALLLSGGTGEFALPKDAAIAVCGLGTIEILLTQFMLEAGYKNLFAIGNKECRFRSGKTSCTVK